MNHKYQSRFHLTTVLSVFVLLLASATSAHADLSYEETRSAYQNSYQYEKTQNYQDAIKAIGVVRLHYPKTYTVNLRLGYLYLQNGQYANALKHYKIAHEVLPDAVSPLLGKMNVSIATKDYNTAEQVGYLIIKDDLYNYYANLNLAYVFIQQKKLDTAEKIVLKMLGKYPEDVAFLTQYAEIQVKREDFSAATELYSNILVLDPENVGANYYFSVRDAKKK